MASQSVTTFASVLKTLYPDRKVPDLVYPNNALFALVNKRTDFYGVNMAVPVTVGDISGLNQSFSSASNNQNGTVHKVFTVTRKTEYGIASIDGELIEASASNSGAFVQGLKSQMDSAFRSVARRIGQALYRDGSGQLGQIAASGAVTLASTALVLKNIEDVVNFHVNQKIVFAANNTSALRSGTSRTITGIDEDTGTLTLDANINDASTAITYQDAIFTLGDYASASDRNRLTGLGGWCPVSAPGTADSFFSLNRSAYPQKLAGHRIVGTTLQIDEAIFKACVRIARSGQKASHVFLSFGQFELLQNVLGSRGEMDKIGAPGAVDVYFDSIRMITPAGTVQVVPDYNCPPDVAFVADMSQVSLCSLGAAPHILGLEGDGLRLLRSASADSYELRVGFYGNAVVWAPYAVARVSLTVPA